MNDHIHQHEKTAMENSLYQRKSRQCYVLFIKSSYPVLACCVPLPTVLSTLSELPQHQRCLYTWHIFPAIPHSPHKMYDPI